MNRIQIGGRQIVIKPQSLIGILTGIQLDESGTASWPPRVQGMGVVITNECQLTCAHCYNQSSPFRHLSLDKEKLIRACECLKKEFPGFKAISLSGGEPFLYPDVEEVAEAISALDIHVSCVTGGGGVSPDEISRLAEHGVSEYAISRDTYHSRFVSEESFLRLVDAASDAVSNVTIKFCVHSEQEYEGMRSKWDGVMRKSIVFEFYGLTPFGRTRRNQGEITDPFKRYNEDSGCFQEFGVIALNSDGKIYPCCSTGGFTPGLELCSIDDLIEKGELSHFYLQRDDLRDIAFNGWDKVPGQTKCEQCNYKFRLPQLKCRSMMLEEG
uniref:4Fe-4S single cluster domain-containing protein n=1 Tax=Candidatus Kentrum sp. LPFa TaxID=2126335 RepID=A0A450WFY9_9GAMM|nr:MAG: 4Fe-4S single cluster domain-containing protein [Candidatus Kentron sp. LPFa]VFK31410.1 MAG: 4Fe-4S single cluster domain-containing protein [Candidatus Kentron sp. LPFa]